MFKTYEKAAEKVVDEAQDKKYSFITQDEFVMIADDDLGDYLYLAEDVVEGHWMFVLGEGEREYEVSTTETVWSMRLR